jgi:hypothetical protein
MLREAVLVVQVMVAVVDPTAGADTAEIIGGALESTVNAPASVPNVRSVFVTSTLVDPTVAPAAMVTSAVRPVHEATLTEFTEIAGFPNWTVAPLRKSVPVRLSTTRFPCFAEEGTTGATTGRAHPVTSLE